MAFESATNVLSNRIELINQFVSFITREPWYTFANFLFFVFIIGIGYCIYLDYKNENGNE